MRYCAPCYTFHEQKDEVGQTLDILELLSTELILYLPQTPREY